MYCIGGRGDFSDFLKCIISYVFLVVGKFILFPFDNFVIYNQVEKKREVEGGRRKCERKREKKWRIKRKRKEMRMEEKNRPTNITTTLISRLFSYDYFSFIQLSASLVLSLRYFFRLGIRRIIAQ